jgi:hypothetical protein
MNTVIAGVLKMCHSLWEHDKPAVPKLTGLDRPIQSKVSTAHTKSASSEGSVPSVCVSASHLVWCFTLWPSQLLQRVVL